MVSLKKGARRLSLPSPLKSSPDLEYYELHANTLNVTAYKHIPYRGLNIYTHQICSLQ